MYVPPHFAESDPATLRDFIERHGFGLLVSEVGGAPFATHLPFLLDREAGPHGTRVGHVARTNPQWRELAGRVAQAAFSGPHAYVSPAWYEAESVVPTWNYVAVHAYGPAQLAEDRDALFDVVRRTVDRYEGSRPRPWSLGEPSTFTDRMLAQIVGFRTPIERIEGKGKLIQNHPPERRQKVIDALAGQGGESAAVA